MVTVVVGTVQNLANTLVHWLKAAESWFTFGWPRPTSGCNDTPSRRPSLTNAHYCFCNVSPADQAFLFHIQVCAIFCQGKFFHLTLARWSACKWLRYSCCNSDWTATGKSAGYSCCCIIFARYILSYKQTRTNEIMCTHTSLHVCMLSANAYRWNNEHK